MRLRTGVLRAVHRSTDPVPEGQASSGPARELGALGLTTEGRGL